MLAGSRSVVVPDSAFLKIQALSRHDNLALEVREPEFGVRKEHETGEQRVSGRSQDRLAPKGEIGLEHLSI